MSFRRSAFAFAFCRAGGGDFARLHELANVSAFVSGHEFRHAARSSLTIEGTGFRLRVSRALL